MIGGDEEGLDLLQRDPELHQISQADAGETADLQDAHGRTAVSAQSAAGQGSEHVLVVDNSVLIIRQMREVHEEIDELITKLTRGERPANSGAGSLGGGGGIFNVR